MDWRVRAHRAPRTALHATPNRSLRAGLTAALPPRPERTRRVRARPYRGRMSLTLITGPANAAKAGAVLERFRAALARDPLLVVPTFADVDHYRRELAAGGMVFGGRGRSPSAGCCARSRARPACRRSAARPGGARPGRARRDRRRARAGARRRRPRRPASRPRPATCSPSSGALARQPARFTAPCGRGRTRAAEPGRAPTPTELARAVRRPTGAGSRRSGAPTRRATRGRRSTRCARTPRAGATRPVLLYGFDDLTAGRARRGRDAGPPHRRRGAWSRCPTRPAGPRFAGTASDGADADAAGRGRARRAARPLRALRAAARGRRCTTSSAGSSSRRRRRLSPNGAVRLLEAGGERAEAELVGGRGARADARGRGAGGHRGPGPRARAAAVRARARRLRDPGGRRPTGCRWDAPASAPACWPSPARHSRAETRATCSAGCGRPGSSTPRIALDGLEAVVRRDGLSGAGRGAGARWERDGGRPLAELDALAAAAARGPRAVRSRRSEREAHGDLDRAAPPPGRGARRRRASPTPARRPSCAPPPRSCAASPAADPALAGGADDVLEALAAVPVRRAGGPAGRGVLVADPLAIRARRFRAVFVCGLQEGEFPRAAARRSRSSTTTSGARWRARPGSCCPMHENVIERERTLFYACVSRPEEVAVPQSSRSADEEGDPLQPSAFLDDVRALFTDELVRAARPAPAGRRDLGAARGADAARAAPRARGRGRPGPSPVRSRRPPPRRCWRRWPGAAGESIARARDLRRLRRALARRAAALARAAPSPIRSRCAAVRWPTGCSSGRCTAAAGARRLGAGRPGDAAGGRGGARAGRWTPGARTVRATAARAAGRRAPRGRPAAGAARTRRECGPGCSSRSAWSGASAASGTPRARSPSTGVEVTGRVDRLDVDRGGGTAIVRDYKHRRSPTRGPAGARTARCRSPCTCSRRASCSASSRWPGLYQPLGGRELAVRGLVRDDAPGGRLRGHRRGRRPASSSRARWRRRARAPRAPARELHAGRIRPCPRALHAARLRLPGDLPRRRGDRPTRTPGRRARDARRRTRDGPLHRRAARGDRRPPRLRAARRQRRLGQDRRDGRALRGGRASATASRCGPCSR